METAPAPADTTPIPPFRTRPITENGRVLHAEPQGFEMLRDTEDVWPRK